MKFTRTPVLISMLAALALSATGCSGKSVQEEGSDSIGSGTEAPAAKEAPNPSETTKTKKKSTTTKKKKTSS